MRTIRWRTLEDGAKTGLLENEVSTGREASKWSLRPTAGGKQGDFEKAKKKVAYVNAGRMAKTWA